MTELLWIIVIMLGVFLVSSSRARRRPPPPPHQGTRETSDAPRRGSSPKKRRDAAGMGGDASGPTRNHDRLTAKPRPLSSDRTARITVGNGRAAGFQVPERPAEDQRPPGSPQLVVGVAFETHHGRFVQQARRRADRRGPEAPHVRFQTYWSTYDDMDRAQEAWYFYWRDQVRRGRMLPTDLSYLFVHIYECLHAIGFHDPQQAFSHLIDVWLTYRDQHPKLDRYLCGWLLDMNAYYALAHDPLELVAMLGERGLDGFEDDLWLAAWLESRDFETLGLPHFRTLSGFDPRSGKFYKQFDDHDAIERALRDAVRATDEFYRERHGYGVFEAFGPRRIRPLERQAFAGAVFGYEPKRVVIAELRPYSESEALKALLESVLKYAENQLRRRFGFNGARRGIELPDDLLHHLEANLLDASSPAPSPPRRQIRIDLEKVKGIEDQSRRIRRRLVSHADGSDEVAAARATSRRFELPPEVPPGQLTDVDAVADVMDQLDGRSLAMLHDMQANGWVTDANVGEASMDAILEHGLALLGEHLVTREEGRWVVEDDYRDELVFLLGLDEYAVPVDSAGSNHEGDDAVSAVAPAAELREVLTPLHLKALARAFDGCAQADLDAFAIEHATMGSLLVEEINEHAVGVIGDVVIDSYSDPLSIIDEHRDLIDDIIHA